jgi:hypothetical protein
MSPNDIASRFFTSWYTIYERVSSCQATAVGATTEFEIRLQTKAVGIGSRLIQRGGVPDSIEALRRAGSCFTAP